MILNYDKENGFTSALFPNKHDLEESSKATAKISDNVEKLFKNKDTNDFFSDLLQDFYKADDFKDDPFKGWVDGLNDTEKETLTCGQALDNFKKSQSEVISNNGKFSKATSTLKNIAGVAGSFLLNAGVSFAIEKGIELAVKGLDKLIVTSDEMIQKGHEAQESIQAQSKAYTEQKNSLEQLTTRYGELAKGVSVTGNKISNTGLSTDEYQEFLDVSNQIATLAPSIGRTFDSQGNAILNAGTNVSELNSQIEDYIKLQRDLTYYETKKNINDQFKGVQEEIKNAEENKHFAEEQRSNFDSELKAVDDFYNQLYKAQEQGESKFFTMSSTLWNKLREPLMESGAISGEDLFNFQDNGETVAFSIDTSQLNIDDIKNAQSAIEEFKSTISGKQGELQTDIQESIAASAEAWNNMLPSLVTLAQSTDAFDTSLWNKEQSSKFQNGITTMLQSLDYEGIKEFLPQYGNDIGDFVQQGIIDPIANAVPEQRKVWEQLLDFDPKSDNYKDKTISELASIRNSIMDEIASFSDSDPWTRETLANAFGFGFFDDNGKFKWNTKSKLDEVQSKMKSEGEEVRDFMNDLSQEDFEIAYSIVGSGNEEALTNLDSFKKKFVELKQQAEADRYSLSSMQSVVANAQTAFSNFSTGINESMSDTGMTTESIQALKDSFSSLSELTGFHENDLNSMFTSTAKGVKLNSEALEKLIQTQHKMKMSDFDKAIASQAQTTLEAKSAYEKAKDETKEWTQALEEYQSEQNTLTGIQQAQSQYLAQYKQQMELFSQYNKWQMATQSENAGDKYNGLFSGLQQAKELYDQGLVGTDEFKEFAAILSPSGATDADNFIENYNKAARYLTDDSSGVKNFLHDLSEKGFAELNEQTQEWTYNIQDMAKAAQSMGMGEEFMTAMFGRLEDYGFSNNFFDSVEEGNLHIDELNEKLAQSKKELALLEASGANETAITAKRDEVNGLVNDILSSNETLDNFETNAAISQYEKTLNAQKAIEKLSEEYKKLDPNYDGKFANNEDAFQGKAIAKAIQEIADENEITLKPHFEVDESSIEEARQKVYGTGTIENPLERQFATGTKDAEHYGSVVSKIQAESAKGNETLKQSFEELSNYSESELKNLNLFDGVYDSEQLQPVEQALDNIIDTLGLSKTEAEQLVNVLADMGQIKIEPKMDEDVLALDELQQSLLKNGTLETTVDLTFDVNTMSIDDLESKIEELEGLKAEIDPEVNPEAIQAIDDLIAKCQKQQTIQVEVEKKGFSDEDLLGMTKEKFEAEVGVNMNDEEWEAFQASVESEQNASVSVKIDKEQFDALTSEQEQIVYEVDDSQVQSWEPPKKEGDINYKSTYTETGNPPEKLGNVKYIGDWSGIGTPPDANGTANFKLGESPDEVPDASGIANFELGDHPTKAPDIYGTATYLGNFPKRAPTIFGTAIYTQQTKASGTMLSPAKASGTAYNVLNTVPYSSYASGKVSLDKNETALVNEVGVESRIRNGVWELLPGKMHMENLKKGDIILNAKQTADLLKHGKTNSFAKSYASGTVEHVRDIATPFLNSYARGSGGGGFQGGAASGGSHSSSTSNNSNAVNQNTHAVSQNTSQTQKNTEKIKHSTQVFDWVKTRLEYFANKTKEIADKVTDFVSFKLKESLLKSQSSSIDKEIQAQQQGYDTYMKKAQSVAEKYTYYDKDENKQTLSIPKKYQELVKNGQWNIEDMDTSTDYNKNLADAIQKYQDYIESATDCKQTIQELKNEQMELWEEIINIPIEEAESKIDRLEKKIKGLENASSTIADGGSSVSRYAYQIEADTGLKSARKKLENANKKKSDASKQLKSKEKELNSSKSDTKNAINSLKYQAKKTENDNLVDKVYANIKNGQYVNTKGLKGEVLKAAKRYNDNLKKQREKQKRYNSSKDSYTTASKNVSTAKKNYNAKKSQLSEVQQVIVDNKDKPSYLAQNALLGLQLQRKREESEIYEQTVLKTQENLKNSEAKKKASEKAREKQESLILGNKDFTKNLSKAQLSAIKSGNLVDRTGIKDPKTLEAINKYNQLAQEARTYTEKYNVALKANEEAVANAAQSQAEYAQMALDNEKQKFENIKTYYDSQVDYLKTQLESLQSKDDLRQEQGGEVLKSQLQRQIDKINEMQKLLKQERDRLQKQLEESVSKGVIDVNSKEWYELKEEIFGIDKQMDGLNKDVLELQDTIRNETFYKEVNKALEKLDEVRASMETIRNLINEQALFDDDGKFTDAGITAFALDIKTYESNLESLNALIRKRNSMIKNFNGGKNDTGYSQKEFDADMKDIESQIRDMLGNANSARKAIIDTVLAHAKAELDAVNKVIDARSELLKKQKEYYDYDKTLKSKTKDIQLLEQQIAALEGVSDAESKAKKAQLEAQLQEQQEDLQDTVFNHQYDLQIQGLDDLKTDLQENYDDYVKELNSNIDKIVETVKNSTDNIKDCVNTVNSTIEKLLNSFGINGALFNENTLKRSVSDDAQTPYYIGIPDDDVTMQMMSMFGFSGDTDDMNEAIRNMNTPMPNLDLPDIQIPDLVPNYEAFNVQPVIECPITIMGNANENEVKRAIRQMIPEIDKEVQKSICRDLRKGGWK